MSDSVRLIDANKLRAGTIEAKERIIEDMPDSLITDAVAILFDSFIAAIDVCETIEVEVDV